MTKIEIVREDEKATAILKAIRQIDDGEELEQVVRCKDCKWYCGIGCVKPYHIRPMGNDDFCSYGERREGE